jgi:hypothetical protein
VHVFQAYPFLSTARRALISCRDFVLEHIPSYDSPVLDKLKVDTEIHNDKATLVRGDGVETASGIQDVNRELNTEESAIEGKAKLEFNSWGRVAKSRLPLDAEDRDGGVSRPDAPDASSRNLRRVQSAVQLINLIHAPPVTAAPRRHRRTMSQSYHAPYPPTFSITPQREMAIY